MPFITKLADKHGTPQDSTARQHASADAALDWINAQPLSERNVALKAYRPDLWDVAQARKQLIAIQQSPISNQLGYGYGDYEITWTA